MADRNVRVTTTSDTFGDLDEILVVEPATSAAIAIPNLARLRGGDGKLPDGTQSSRIAIIKNKGPGTVVISDPGGRTIDGAPAFTIGAGQSVMVFAQALEYGLIGTPTN